MKEYSMTDVAKMVGCSRQNIHYMIQRGTLKARRVGNFWVLKESDIQHLLNKKDGTC